MDIELTREEKSAIAALKRVAARWPKSLWLFSADGTLTVMRCGPDGEPVMVEGSTDQSVDRAYIVDVIVGIPNDGGDW